MNEVRTTLDDLHKEYVAKGWPPIDPRKPDYCYQPCRFGLHVCGEHPDGMNCLTVANFPTRGSASARELFDRAKAEVAVADGEDGDFVVDLMLNSECEEDFTMNRQMLDRLRSIASAESSS